MSLQPDSALQGAHRLSALDQYLGGRSRCACSVHRGRCCCWRLRLQRSLAGLPSLSFPLVGPGGLRRARGTAACHLLLQTSVLAAFHADELSILPPLFPAAALPPLSPEKVIKMGVQTAGRCSRCFPACPVTGKPALPHRYLGSQICKPPASSQVCQTSRKPNGNKVHTCKADTCEQSVYTAQ